MSDIKNCDEYKAFIEAVRSIPTNHVAKALTSLTPGADWARCSKSFMAERYANACCAETKSHWHKGIHLIDLRLLAHRAKARQEGLADWWESQLPATTPKDRHEQ